MAIIQGPHTPQDDGEIVVFLIGMTFNKPWKVRSWLPIFLAMPKMLRELAMHPELGLLENRMTIGSRGPVLVQYWRSIEHLESFARARDRTHMPAWSAFMKSAAAKNTDVGIWHESFVTRPGEREALYVSTPRMGFGAAADTYRPVGPGDETAEKRRGRGVERPAPMPAPAERAA